MFSAKANFLILKWVFYLAAIGAVFADHLETGHIENTKLNNYTVFSKLKDKFESGVSDYIVNFSRALERFNDGHLADSYMGKLIRYNELKPKIVEADTSRRRTAHKMSTAMLPLVFHVGATSTWMVLTAVMTAKSVLIGIILLVFKIAVSSAKVSSFFTALKHKHWTPTHDHHHDHHHDWTYSSHDHHGHERSMTFTDSHQSSYQPEWQSSTHDEHANLIWPVGKKANSEWPVGKQASSIWPVGKQASYKSTGDSYNPNGSELEPYGGYEYADETSQS